MSETVKLRGLTPGRQYYVQIKGKGPDGEDVGVWSEVYSFIPPGDTIPPPEPSFTVNSVGSTFVLTMDAYTKPEDFARFVVVVEDGLDSTAFDIGSTDTFTLTSQSNEAYFGDPPSATLDFKVYAFDYTGNPSTTATVQHTIPVPTAPVLSAVRGIGYVELSWTGLSPNMLREYVVKVDGVEVARTTSTSYTHTSIEEVDYTIEQVDAFGRIQVSNLVTENGAEFDLVPPEKPSPPTLTAGLLSVIVRHDLTLALGGPLPNDMEYLEIHASPTAGIVPSSTTLVYVAKATYAMISQGLGAIGQFSTDAATVYVAVRAVDTSGNESVLSDEVSISPFKVGTEDIDFDAIDSTLIADGSIETPHLTAGAVVADKIAANTITAAQIAADTITGNEIAAGSITAIDAVFGNAAIQSADIADAAITNAKIDSLTWDKGVGGTLTLGGVSNTLGTLYVLDATGEETVFELDQQDGGFGASNFYVGDLTSPTVTKQSTSSKTFYVHPGTGSDTNLGTEVNPLASISEALERCEPNMAGGSYTIFIYGGTSHFGDVVVRNFSRGTFVFNRYGAGAAWDVQGRFILTGNSGVHVYISDGEIRSKDSQYGIFVDTGTFARINNTDFYGSDSTTYGIMYRYGSSGYVVDCEFYDVDRGIQLLESAQVQVINCRGLGNVYGIQNAGGVCTGSGTAPGGGTANQLATNNGYMGSWTTNTGAATTPAAPATTSTWSANWFRSWRDGAYRSDTRLIQGEWGGYGNHRGLMGFDDAAIRSTLAGRTIDRVRITMKRDSAGGSSSAGLLAFWTHTVATQPSSGAASAPGLSLSNVPGVTWSWGQTKTADLPISHGNALRDNTAKGIAIYSSSGTPYMPMNETATLTISHH